MTELEPESAISARARRRRQRMRMLIVGLFAATFVVCVRAADHLGRAGGEGAPFAAVFAAAAVITLVVWFAAYIVWHRRLDEFERALEERAIALAAGATILFAAAWGVLEATLNAPDFPIALLAPAFGLLYAAARIALSSGYR